MVINDLKHESCIPREIMMDHSLFSQSYRSHDMFEFSSLNVRQNKMMILGKDPIPNEQKFT